jgi:hypothetical protein
MGGYVGGRRGEGFLVRVREGNYLIGREKLGLGLR